MCLAVEVCNTIVYVLGPVKRPVVLGVLKADIVTNGPVKRSIYVVTGVHEIGCKRFDGDSSQAKVVATRSARGTSRVMKGFGNPRCGVNSQTDSYPACSIAIEKLRRCRQDLA